MKNYQGLLLSVFVSATALTLAVACAPSATDSVNARRGQPCDNKTRMCMNEKTYAKLGTDSLVDDLLKELDAEKDAQKKEMNKRQAKKLQNIVLVTDQEKITLTLNDGKNSQKLTGSIKDKQAELTNVDKSISATVNCLDQDGNCSTAKIAINTEVRADEIAKADGKIQQNGKFQTTVKAVEKKIMTKVLAIVRSSLGELSATEQDTADKSDAFKKLYDLIMSKSRGSHDQNSVDKILAQTSEIANGRSYVTSLIITNEKEVIGLEGDLEIKGRGTDGATSNNLKKNINEDLLKKLKAEENSLKKTIHESIDRVVLTNVDSGNRLGIQFLFKGKEQKQEQLQSFLVLTQVAGGKTEPAKVEPPKSEPTTPEAPKADPAPAGDAGAPAGDEGKADQGGDDKPKVPTAADIMRIKK